MRRTTYSSSNAALSGLMGLAAVVTAVVIFFIFFFLPFVGQLQQGLAPLMALAR